MSRGTAPNLEHLAAVRDLIRLYVDAANGEAELRRRAFHPDARMCGHTR